MNSTGLKGWKGLKASSDTTDLKGESMPCLHGLKTATVQPPTVQSQGHLALDAQNDAHSEVFAHQNAGFGGGGGLLEKAGFHAWPAPNSWF